MRKGAEVDQKALEQYFVGMSANVLRRAQTILGSTFLDLLTDAQCVRWGEEEQKRFGELTQKVLDLISAPAVKDGTVHLNRLYALLKEISAAFGHKNSQGFFGSFNAKPDPKKVFEQNQPELNQLWQLLDRALPEIEKVEASLRALTTEFDELAFALDAQSLAATYLAEQLIDKTAKALAIQTLADRSASLLKTVALIKQGTVLRGEQANTLRQLVTRIQEGVLNALPSWIQAVTMTFQKPAQTETDVYSLRNGLDTIVNQLS